MRLATFNLENLDISPRAPEQLERRIEALRPQLERLAADVLCLQEVNAQHVAGKKERRYIALDRLLEGTPYAGYSRVFSHRAGTGEAASVHNLVTLSRFPVLSQRELLHHIVPPMAYRLITARPPKSHADVIVFDRPALVA
jgi:endonuclease/exonuclease/phosphatase family metal-dependent hydrolase